MKKFTLSLALVLGIFSTSNAQISNLLPSDPDRTKLQIVEPINQLSGSDRREDGGGWYSFLNSYASFNGFTVAGNTSVSWLFPDSAQIQFTDGPGRVRVHVVGSTFDPKDPVFIGAPNQFSRWTNYTFDSMAWLQFYIRNVDKMDKATPVAASGSLTVVDFNQLAGAIFSIDGIDLTEGSEWNASIDNDTTASSLGAAIAALQVSGNALYSVSVNSNTVNITYNTAGISGNSVTLSSSDVINLPISGSTLTGGGNQIVEVDIVDTLYIQYYTPAGGNMTFGSYTQGGQGPYYFGQPRPTTFSTRTLLNSSAFKTDTLLLTAEFADSVAGGQIFGRQILSDIGITVNGSNMQTDNVIASTFTYKPMKPFTINDTIMNFSTSGVNVSNLNNGFGMRFGRFTDHAYNITNQEAINHSLITNFEVRYGQNLFGFLRGYIPGNLFGTAFIHDHFYHVSTQSLSAVTPNANGYGIGDAYPNPTDNSEAFTVPFTLGASNMVTFTVTDITGKVVKTISNNYSAGENFVTIETSNLTSGIYIYTMTTGSFSGVGKVIVR